MDTNDTIKCRNYFIDGIKCKKLCETLEFQLNEWYNRSAWISDICRDVTGSAMKEPIEPNHISNILQYYSDFGLAPKIQRSAMNKF